jgi:ribosomal protein L37AE/L43A
MMSVRELTRQYNSLLKDVAEKDFYKIDLSNRVNCYACQSCKRVTKTRDIDAGVTPFMFSCEHCGETAYSTFYKDIAPHKEPTFEWYRPTLKECLKMRGKHEGLLDHVLKGGLEVRNILK